ncbi:cellulose biosynthesis protein BcsE [Sodalis sp. dw_96]|uniref:cellulose biosynthesis protein BcsE n=1 Tax=Sodalis sp. dw_96 TaxID=2719794 RepID=UPI001BD6B7CF|nr:cellulose biosynthesis protein BcsE [Sodalis sp. dw_96]
MALSFSFGIYHSFEELSVMQSHGCYWVNIERQGDARQLCRQIINAQGAATRAALICCGDSPEQLLEGLPPPDTENAGPPASLPLFRLPEKKSALRRLTSDLLRACNVKDRLFILLFTASAWQDFSQTEIDDWLGNTRRWLIKHGATFLILSYGSGVSQLKNQLISQFPSLSGLSSVQSLQDCVRYQVSWWFSGKGLIANQAMTWEMDDRQRFVQSILLPSYSPSVNDEQLCLAEKSVLEGAPPLSVNWRLLEDNALLMQQGMLRHSATLIFALTESEQVAELAQQIHTLRRQRGVALKIVVREMKASLRYTDERLLQACGANLVVPYIAPLSSFLTLLESIQGQRFTRHVPATVDPLLAAVNPSRLKGAVSNDTFRQVVPNLIENPLMPEDDKGILIALRPVPGLPPRQALSLCRLRRGGDLVTATPRRIYLFLSNCRINDLDTVLGYIFRLPIAEAFSNRQVWTHDVQIISEVRQIGKAGSPQADDTPITAAVAYTRPASVRHNPRPLTLSFVAPQDVRP